MSKLEHILTHVLQIKDAILAIGETYALMPPLIDEEHDAIASSDLDKVEGLTARKLFLGSQLDTLFARLKAACQALAQYTEGREPANQSNLSTSFSAIESLIAAFTESGENTAQLNAVYQETLAAFEKFLASKEKAQNKIEVNRYVLAKVLFNRQENYRFWQEVAADSMSAYDRGGKQKAARSNSILNVKA